MARYINDLVYHGQADEMFGRLHQHLTASGFEYIQYDGENVFKKGVGVFTAPTFIKIIFNGGYVRVEAWIKYTLLPGIYVGEFGMTGAVGAAMKGTMKKAVEEVEGIITQGYYVQPTARYCTNCGMQLEQGAAFCSNCGIAFSGGETHVAAAYNQVSQSGMTQAVNPQWISRKDFVEKYARPSYKREIKNIAIMCYICAGLSALVAIILSPLGLIDALLLAGLALGMHLRKSKMCAIFLLVTGCMEMLAGIIATGKATSMLWVIGGIWAVVTFNKLDKEYKAFKSGTH